MISIIIPIYNRAHQLELSLKKIQAQTYQDFEIIIVNDGSSDEPQVIVNKFKNVFEQRLLYVEQENKGAQAARNRGLREARGEYLLFSDADVLFEPDALYVFLDVLNKHPEASYAYSSFKWGPKLFKLFPFDENKLREMPYIHSTSLVRKEHFPGWDESVQRLQDWDLWLTMLENGHKGVWIDRVLFQKQSGGTMSKWLPSFFYKLFPFLPSVKKYKLAVEKVKRKHGILTSPACR